MKNFTNAALRELVLQDTEVLHRARGWVGLKLYGEAVAELSTASRFAATRVDFLEIRSLIHAAKGEWQESLDCADAMIVEVVDTATAYCLKAEAVKHLNGVRAALEILEDAVWRFPKSALVYFNISCYCCELGNLCAARKRLVKCFNYAFGTDEDGLYQRIAAFDEDLKMLWMELPRIKEIALRLNRIQYRRSA